MIIITTTKSTVKLDSIKKCLNPSKIISFSTENADLPNQPINSGLVCCHKRIDYIKSNGDLNSLNADHDFIISIENGIDTINHYSKGGDYCNFVDICYVVIEDKNGNRQEFESIPIKIPRKYVEKARNMSSANYIHTDLGYEQTAGKMISLEYPHIDHANWMKDSLFGGVCRTKQIESAISQIAAI
jgi:non-canonical (house-cleaning) NTP pyrophosphatase